MPAPNTRGTCPFLAAHLSIGNLSNLFRYFRCFFSNCHGTGARILSNLFCYFRFFSNCPGTGARVSPKKMPGGLPVSRDLVRIVKESSRLEGPGLTLDHHVRAVEERQAKSVEFYLRACALRLEQGL